MKPVRVKKLVNTDLWWWPAGTWTQRKPCNIRGSFRPCKGKKKAFEETVGTLELSRVKESISGGRVRLMCIFFLESVNCPPHVTLDVLRPHLVKESHYKRRKCFKNTLYHFVLRLHYHHISRIRTHVLLFIWILDSLRLKESLRRLGLHPKHKHNLNSESVLHKMKQLNLTFHLHVSSNKSVWAPRLWMKASHTHVLCMNCML